MKKIKHNPLALIAAGLLTFSLLFTTGCQLLTGSDNKGGSSSEETGSSTEESGSSGSSSSTKITVGDFAPQTTSVAQAAEMAIGWNLGNTLDSCGTDSYSYSLGVNAETYWGLPKTTKAMIDAVHDAGFKTIRIPVSWHNHISKTDSTDYTINAAWMARVKEIVDWAIADKMCVIINIHHDNMAISTINSNPGFALSDDSDIQTKSKNYISKVWTQIATEFKDYDNSLVFEVLNEPRDYGGEWKGNEWWTNNKEMIAVITDYEQAAIDAIRSVKGNEKRFIMVPGYAASGSDSGMLKLYTMPSDSATDRLILSAHAYSPYAFAMSDTTDKTFDSADEKSLDSIFAYLKSAYIDKGIGVVMGEASASDKKNTAERVKWAAYYYTKAADCGIPVILWDNMVTVANGGDISSGECHGYFNRNKLTWYFPTIMEAMMKATYGDDYSGAVTAADSSTSDDSSDSNTTDDNATETKLLSESVDLNSWIGSIVISADKVEKIAGGSKLEITTSASADGKSYYQIKLSDGGWQQITPKGTIVSATINSDGLICPANQTGIVSYTFTTDEAALIKSKGFVLQGCGVAIDKLILVY